MALCEQSYRPLQRFCKIILKISKKVLTKQNACVIISSLSAKGNEKIVGVDCGEGPPVPIPNTEVKLTCAENTWRAAAWENK